MQGFRNVSDKFAYSPYIYLRHPKGKKAENCYQSLSIQSRSRVQSPCAVGRKT